MEKINFKRSGNGPSVILLHGFPMNSQVWTEFASELSTKYTVYTPDLPGFGSSSLPSLPISLKGVAAMMNDWVADQWIQNSVLIGHSMGGYVALEMIGQNPTGYAGLCLFHSTALPDSPEKQESRTKVIRFIDDNGVLAFTSNFIQPLFANENHSAIPTVKDITIQAEADTVKAYTIAMRDRADNTEVLRTFGKPVLLLGGDKDKGIPVESLQNQSELGSATLLRILEDTGHMGMFEKKAESLGVVREFLVNIFG